ncbi:hypothetical protein BDW22DRAFT_1481038 [Trametopsis cervina]|nr:hypothetical protein BDW22DRAFT_1481038 [Trametopsis cervina]
MTSVYIGRIPHNIERDQLLVCLEMYGHVNALSIREAFAFVEYKLDEDAKKFVDTFANRAFMGYPSVKVELAKTPRQSRNSSGQRVEHVRYPITVYNLHSSICWQTLKDFGKQAGGEVAFCNINRRNRGHVRGYLEYYTEEDAIRFIEQYNGAILLGNVVRLMWKGRQTLREEHGPPARSPAHSHRSRLSSNSPPMSRSGRSRSRSRSPLSSRRHAHSRGSVSSRGSPPLLSASLSRYEHKYSHRARDRYDDTYKRGRSPLRRNYMDRAYDDQDRSPLRRDHMEHPYDDLRKREQSPLRRDYMDRVYVDQREPQSSYTFTETWDKIYVGDDLETRWVEHDRAAQGCSFD